MQEVPQFGAGSPAEGEPGGAVLGAALGDVQDAVVLVGWRGPVVFGLLRGEQCCEKAGHGGPAGGQRAAAARAVEVQLAGRRGPWGRPRVSTARWGPAERASWWHGGG